MIQFNQVSVDAEKSGARILSAVSGQFARGGFHVVCGPNGSGKTTLLRALCGLQSLTAGDVLCDQRNITPMSERERSTYLSWVPAEQPVSFGYTVHEVVLWGRWFRHQGTPTKSDRLRIDEAMETMGLTAFKDRAITELSLGEQKRVHLARAIAADTPYLLLDEPCGPLDAGVTLDIISWIQNVTRTSGKTIIASLHDLALIANFADTILLLKGGQSIGQGQTREILSTENMRTAFGVKMHQTASAAGTLILLTREN